MSGDSSSSGAARPGVEPVVRAALGGVAPPIPVEVRAGIRTRRLVLRPLEARDEQTYLRAVNESREALEAFMPLHRPGEADDLMFARQLEFVKREQAAGQCYRCAAFLEDGRVAGGFNLNAITRGLELKADITWWVATPLCGRGLATEGVAGLLAHALADLPRGLGLHQVQAWISRDNEASIRLAERVGLRRQGDTQSYLQTGERWAVHEMYARHAWDVEPDLNAIIG